ncbi:MAG: hypothetical protein FJW63_08690 [Actinobacteria bacterium]|nr:hypothetical protein [Actinomycetota bacterium]
MFMVGHQSRPAGCEMTMITYTTSSPETCGIVELDEKGVVQTFQEKVGYPLGNLANGAVYIRQLGIFNFLKDLQKFKIGSSTEVLPRYIGRIHTFHKDFYHRYIGTMESYLAAKQKAKSLKFV